MGEFMGEKRDYITLEVIHHNAYEQQPTEEPETPAPSISHIRAEARTKKSAATRKRIMHETTKLMLARGNTNFKMSEISDRARLSKGALYYYFSDREALLQAIFDESVDELAKDIAHTIGNKPASKETLHAIIAQLAAHILPDSPLVLALINKLASSEQAPYYQTLRGRFLAWLFFLLISLRWENCKALFARVLIQDLLPVLLRVHWFSRPLA